MTAVKPQFISIPNWDWPLVKLIWPIL